MEPPFEEACQKLIADIEEAEQQARRLLQHSAMTNSIKRQSADHLLCAIQKLRLTHQYLGMTNRAFHREEAKTDAE